VELRGLNGLSLPLTLDAIRALKRYIAQEVFGIIMRRQKEINQTGSSLDKQKGDRGSQYVSIRYSERLVEAGIEPSVGSVGDSYDNALAETINGLYKAEVIHRRGRWRSFEAVEFATLE
jgi:transposase InsO family protein